MCMGVFSFIRYEKMVTPLLPVHVTNMLDSRMSDIEDALQVQSALEGECDIIVTRNIQDFSLSEIPAIAPDDFLGRITA